MKKHIHVVGAVIVQDGLILCAQRGEHQSLPFMWEFPGGKVEEGETLQQALQREILEEMNCRVEIGERIESTTYEYEFAIVHLTTFYCRLVDGTPILNEHADMRWLPVTELNTLDWAPADIPTVDKLMKQGIIS